jgi:hypothetical protein
LAVQIHDGADKLREHAADEAGSEERPVARSHVEQVSARIVAEDQNRTGLLDAPRLKVHHRGVPHRPHDLQLPFQAHLDALLGGAAAGAVLADFDSHERPPIVGRLIRARPVVLVLARRRAGLARGQVHLAEGALAEYPEGAPTTPFPVMTSVRLEVHGMG